MQVSRCRPLIPPPRPSPPSFAAVLLRDPPPDPPPDTQADSDMAPAVDTERGQKRDREAAGGPSGPPSTRSDPDSDAFTHLALDGAEDDEADLLEGRSLIVGLKGVKDDAELILILHAAATAAVSLLFTADHDKSLSDAAMATTIASSASVAAPFSKDFRSFSRSSLVVGVDKVYLFEVSPTQGRFFTMSDGQFEFANDLLVDRARDLRLPISLGGSDRLLSFHPFSIFETTEPGEIDSVFGHILLHCKGAVKGFGRSGVERLLNRPLEWLGGSAGAENPLRFSPQELASQRRGWSCRTRTTSTASRARSAAPPPLPRPAPSPSWPTNGRSACRPTWPSECPATSWPAPRDVGSPHLEGHDADVLPQ